MLTTTPQNSTTLTLPIGTQERVEIPDVHVAGYPNPTTLQVETQLSAAAPTLALGDALDLTEFDDATWADNTTIRSHKLLPPEAGTYGLWVRITVADELVIRYAGRVVFA